MQDEVFVLKISILGDSGVGKTSILVRYIQDLFNDEIEKTLNVNSLYKQICLKGKIVKVNFIDVPGKIMDFCALELFLRNIDGFVVVLDKIEEEWGSVEKWVEMAEKFARDERAGIVMFNKWDEDSETEPVLDQTKLKVFKVSAKHGTGISTAFTSLILEIIQSYSSARRNSISLNKSIHLALTTQKKGKKCC